jgi:hypothetical protein
VQYPDVNSFIHSFIHSSQCQIYLVHYCYEHLKSHLHPITAKYHSLSSQRDSSHERCKQIREKLRHNMDMSENLILFITKYTINVI